MKEIKYKVVDYKTYIRYFIERDKGCYCEGNDIDDTLCFNCSVSLARLTRKLGVKERDVFFSNKLKGDIKTI